jgi:EAL domain-containing protein (putative c-di-GMP-specific phosphodiesterase class I)
MPLDEIKLDRRFTRDAAVNTRSTAIVKSVLDLTHALGLRMVAEGVEDRRAHAVLKHLGCDLLQGRHLGKPAPAGEFETRLCRPTGGKHRLPL